MHTGPLFVAVAVGSAFTTTVVVAVFVQVLFDMVTVYVPAITNVALAETMGL